MIFYYIYVLQSQKDNSLYIGFTQNVQRRLTYHNSGQNISTRGKVPYDLVYFEAYCSKADALGREKFLKGGSGRKYIKKQLKHYFEGY